MEIIHENEYVYKMNDEIEPYLATHRQEGYIPGAEDHLHRKDMGIVGKIHVQRYLAEKPKGVIIISHGFTEAAPKYDEMILLFSEGWISCVYAGTYGTWTKLSSDSRFISCTYRYLEAICERFFENMPCN